MSKLLMENGTSTEPGMFNTPWLRLGSSTRISKIPGPPYVWFPRYRLI